MELELAQLFGTLGLLLARTRPLLHRLQLYLFCPLRLVGSLLLQDLPLDGVEVEQVLGDGLVLDGLEADFLENFIRSVGLLRVVLVAIAQAAAQRERRELVVGVGRRMGHP